MYGLLWFFGYFSPKWEGFVENSIKNQFIISGFAPVCKIWAQFLGRAALEATRVQAVFGDREQEGGEGKNRAALIVVV